MASELDTILESIRGRKMSRDELENQRVNFAYGNAPEEDRGTIASMRAASTILKESKRD